ncbi:HlyD family secretion protein [Entomobacter blattae]|uniref:HlyD family secretion protein n=1 Tax=Entomobacter blattae TaxID=2762277 RepID=A0A7H1NRI1_9PROT|nr:HlyD family efflux transporter periplasmic adaptor subunit [Entomobacter blattae]QNT78391.1 HlyD family secretion protein [Entomobacter blattae]
MTLSPKTRLWGGIIILLLLLGGAAWYILRPKPLGPGFASGNGRIEATEVDISAKNPGRVLRIFFDEGDFVSPHALVAQQDTSSLQAQRVQAIAYLQEATNRVTTTETVVVQRQADKNAAQAVLAQRQAELIAASKHAKRSATLAHEGATPMQEYDDDLARQESAKAAVVAAKAKIAAADAAISTARTQVIGARAQVKASKAEIARLDSDIHDANLYAPIFGRVQYRIVQPGEVVASGGKILNMVDLQDIYMTFFIPETATGKITMGAEARIVLDALPDDVIPASISYVSDVAQFTPKTVETESERQKLMFRVKAKISPQLLRDHIRKIKTGLPGMAYVRLDPKEPWPESLRLKKSPPEPTPHPTVPSPSNSPESTSESSPAPHNSPDRAPNRAAPNSTPANAPARPPHSALPHQGPAP